MHFKQSFLDPPYRKNYDSHHQQHSSLQESPIPTHFRQDSDRSPQQYLYPESLQRNRNARRVYDLKQRIVGLLEKLKEWLEELCLTDACVNDVGEQLEPIIDELGQFSEEQSSDSNWFSVHYGSDNRHSVLKDSSSLVGAQNHRNQSILIHESRERSEVWLLSQGEKNLVRIFFKKYCRLLQNSLYRINRYSGQKKLKFLLETNIRSIFSQTLRISYDLKLIDFTLRQQRNNRTINNKYAFVNLIATRINMIFYQKGSVKSAFQTLKSVYYDQVKKDIRTVENMVDKFQRLNKIYSKNALQQLQKFTFKWRQSAYKCKLEQQIFLVDCIRSKIYQILNELAELGDNSSDFGTHWRYLIECALNSICTQLFGEQDCFFMNLQEIMNERSTKREKLITLADFLLEQDSDSRVGIDRSFLTQLTIEQLRACILSGQIHRNEKSQHNLLLIPIKPASGIFFVRLQTEVPSSSQIRSPMRLPSFRCLLRIIQLITPIIEHLASVCRRVEACWEQKEKNEHYSLLLKEFLKADLTNNEEGHLQIQCKSSEIQIDSHRLESSAETARNIMEKCGIACLMIYHCRGQKINQMPCILFGNSEIPTSQRYIIQSIYDQLVNSGKDHIVVNRNGQIFNILPIWQKGTRIGLVNYVLYGDKVDNQVVSQCLVPLLLKCQGKIECQYCQVSLKIPEINHEKSIDETDNGSMQLINYESSIKLIGCQTLLQLQTGCQKILKEKGNYFFKMVYKIDLSQMNTFYTINSNKEIELIHLKDMDKLMHRQMFIEDYTSLTNCSPFAKLAYNSPCFNNPQLYIYQNQNQYPLRFVAIPIKNGSEHYGYVLSSFYHIDNKDSEHHIAFLSKIVEALNLNHNIFRPSKLNDFRLEQYIRNEQLKESKYIQGQIFKSIIQPKNGKLTEQLLDLSTNITFRMSQINNNKYECIIKAFKLNTITKKIKTIVSTNQQYGETKVDDQVIERLNIQNIIYTHERLTSSECKLKKIGPNRTIKPIRTQNLNNINVFLPTLPLEPSHQLYELLKNKYELKGVIAGQNLDFIQDLNRKLLKYALKENHIFSLMKIGHNQRYNEMYFVIFQHQIVEFQDKYAFNQCVITRSHSIYTRIFQKSSIKQISSDEKMKKIRQIFQLMPRKQKIRNAVLSLKNNIHEAKNNITKLFSKLQKYICNNKDLNLVYYKILKMGFDRLKQLNQQKMKTGLILLQRILPIFERIQYKQSKSIGFRAIYESNPHINQNRVCLKINNTLQQKLENSFKQSFSAIYGMSKLRKLNRQIDHSDSARKIYTIVSNIQKRQVYDQFFTQINKIHQQFINSFDLVEQEFQNIEFSSRQAFIIFANERFEAILRHIGYGLVYKVEIGVGQLYQKSLIIYRQNNQYELSQTITQKPVSLQPQNHNNFSFIPIKTKFSNNNFLIYKVSSKDNCKFDKELSIIKKCIKQGIVPCFQRYLLCQLDKAYRFCNSILRITCKQMWNGAIDETQGIYAFGKGNNYQVQCDKIRVLSTIKQFKRANLIKELKMIRHAINEETKQYYRLEYQYNAINSAISCGVPIEIEKDEIQVYQKYGDIIGKDKLREQRQATDILEIEYEKKSLQYQIKSKTFATSKIIMFWDKKYKEDIQNTKISLIMNKQIQSDYKNSPNLEKAIVEGKIKISENAQKLKNLHKKKQSQSAISMFLLFNHISKANLQKSKKQAFMTIAWPKASGIRV